MDSTQKNIVSCDLNNKGINKYFLAKEKQRVKQKEKRKEQYFRNKREKNHDEDDMS